MGLGCEITEGHTLIKLTSKTIGIVGDGREEERDSAMEENKQGKCPFCNLNDTRVKQKH